MNITELCEKFCPTQVPKGKLLGSGWDGEVFSLLNEPDRVIKYSSYHTCDPDHFSYERCVQVLEFIKDNQPPAYVRVYDYRRLLDTLDMTLFYVVLEKLQEISEDEERLFHSILSHEDFGKKKDLSVAKVEELISGMDALDFDAKKVRLFCDNIKAASLSHNDIHPRNIMKDDMGNFKLIDLDYVILENEDGK